MHRDDGRALRFMRQCLGQPIQALHAQAAARMAGVERVDRDQANVANVGPVLEGVRVLRISRNGREPIGKGFARGVTAIVVAEHRQHADTSRIERCQHRAQVRIFLGRAGVDQIAGQDDGCLLYTSDAADDNSRV